MAQRPLRRRGSGPITAETPETKVPTLRKALSDMFGWLFDYFVVPAGLEIRLFGFLLVYRLNKQSIVGARVIERFNFIGSSEFGCHPWNTLRLGNRWRRRWVLLEKRAWPRFLSISPNNPDAFIRALDLPSP
jgi:hypothetical protein